MPNWKKVIVSGSDAVLNEITASGGILTSQDIMPDSDNALSLGSSTQRFQLNGGTPVTVDGSGTSNTITRFQSATTVENSTISNSDSITTITHDNDGNDIFIVSGSNGELIKVTDTIGNALFQVNDGSGITKFEVSSSGLVTADSASFDWIQVPQIIATSAFVPQPDIQRGYIPWTNVNQFEANTTTGYWRFFAPYDGYIKEIIVHPHTSDTSGTCTITPYVDGSAQSGVQETISGTAGTATTFSFGQSGYSFTSGQYLNLLFDREEDTRATGFSFTIVLIVNSTT